MLLTKVIFDGATGLALIAAFRFIHSLRSHFTFSLPVDDILLSIPLYLQSGKLSFQHSANLLLIAALSSFFWIKPNIFLSVIIMIIAFVSVISIIAVMYSYFE